MLNEFPLQSCVNLFRATYGAACACSLEDKKLHLKQWEHWQNDGAWVDARLSFSMKPTNQPRSWHTTQRNSLMQTVEFDCTPLEYQLLSWDLPDLSWAVAQMGPQDRMVLPHLSKNFQIFSQFGATANAFDSEFENVAMRFHSWTNKYAYFSRPLGHQFSAWQALCGREFFHTDETIEHIQTLLSHWPLMNEHQLMVSQMMLYSDKDRLPVFDNEWGKPLPLGTLIMLVGFTPQAKESSLYHEILYALPHNDRAIIEKWNICLGMGDNFVQQTRVRKM